MKRYEIVWTRPERAPRGPAPTRTRAGIAAAAVALADAEGLDAVSMRRVAAALDTGAASLYRYVATREQLLDLMVDAAGAEYDLASPPSGDWLADLLGLAHQVRAVLRRHPWLVAVLETRPAPGPNGLRFLEAAVRAMRFLPVGARTKLEAAAMLVGVVTALVRNERAEAELARRAGVGPDELAHAQADYLRAAVGPTEHPELTRLLAEPPEQAGDQFDRVVGRVLAGLLDLTI